MTAVLHSKATQGTTTHMEVPTEQVSHRVSDGVLV